MHESQSADHLVRDLQHDLLAHRSSVLVQSLAQIGGSQSHYDEDIVDLLMPGHVRYDQVGNFCRVHVFRKLGELFEDLNLTQQ